MTNHGTLFTLGPRREVGVLEATALSGLIATHRVVLLRAPAGYGKTTHLANAYRSLRDRGARTAWVDLKAQGVQGGASSGAELEEHLDAMVQLASETGGPLHLFVDGLETLRNTPSESLLARHVELSNRDHGPDIRWVLTTRVRPGWPVARWRATGLLAEWSVSDFRLTDEESISLLARTVIRPMKPAVIAAVTRVADGWPLGIRALGRRLSEGNDHPVQDACTLDLADYFSEEVYPSLGADLQEWLPAVGLLERFTAPLCDAVNECSNSHELITRLSDEGGFVVPLGDMGRQWRLHPLFSMYVVRFLETHPGQRTMAHQRASRWFQVQGDLDAALVHAERSGDPEFLAQSLDQSWDAVNKAGNFSRMIRLAQGLPSVVLARWPRVLMWQALYLTVERRFEEAERLLNEVEPRIEQHQPQSVFPDEMVAQRYVLVHRRLSLALFRDDIDACEQHLARLNELAPGPEPYLRGLSQVAEVAIGRHRWRLPSCEAPAFASQALFMDLGHMPGLVWHACFVGPMLMQRGQVNGALVHFRRAMAHASELPCANPDDVLVYMPLSLLAEAQLECGDLDAARESFARAIPGARAIGPLDVSLALLIGRARLASFDGDTATAKSVLDRAQSLAHARGFERLRWAVLHERVRQRLLVGDVSGAHISAREAGLPDAEQAFLAQHDAPLVRETQALTRVRLLLAVGKSAPALKLAQMWTRFGAERGSVATAVRAGLLCAQALQALGDQRAAQRAVARALLQAGDGGMVFSFVETPEPVRALLYASLDVASADLRDRLLSLLAPQRVPSLPDAMPSETLTGRETEILRLVATGLLYREIGERIGLTEGSVKWYMQQIYSKLGVRRRLAAIERGRLLSYL